MAVSVEGSIPVGVEIIRKGRGGNWVVHPCNRPRKSSVIVFVNIWWLIELVYGYYKPLGITPEDGNYKANKSPSNRRIPPLESASTQHSVYNE